MDAYVIKIYRRNKDDPHALVGQIENVDKGHKHAFHNTQELLNLLNLPSAPDNQSRAAQGTIKSKIKDSK